MKRREGAVEQPERQHRARRDLPLSPKLRWQLRLFYLIALVMLAITGYRVVRGEITPLLALLFLALGIGIGALVSRTSRLDWDAATGTIVSQIDLLGGVILALYLLFALAKGRLIGLWVADAQQVSILGLDLTAGVMVGRVVFTGGGIRALLRAADPRPSRESAR
jgi:hypothetical protein